MPRFRVDARDVPAAKAAARLGMGVDRFYATLPNLIERGFPRPDPDTENFDLAAIDRWCDARHPHLFGAAAAVIGARDAKDCVAERIASMRVGGRG